MVTLGCPKNEVDSEVLLAQLEDAGYALVIDPVAADLTIVNTCAFIEEAERESIETILGLARERGPKGLLLVAGCLAERHGAELLREIPEIDGLLGPGRLDEVPALVEAVREGGGERIRLGRLDRRQSWQRRLRVGPPHIAYVKIAEGCDHRCRFCLIPRLRGPLRSRRADEILAEVRALGEEGVREVVLVAQDTTAYGRDLQPGDSLASLLRRLLEEPGPEWIRLLYTHPELWDDELIELCAAGGRLLPYIDLPIQHASDAVLRTMGRGSTAAGLAGLIERLRTRIPRAILRTTVITGHPGEGEAEFAQLREFLQEFPFDRLGVFAYSPVAETLSASAPGRPCGRLAEERRQALLELQRPIALSRQRARRGERTEVLIDGLDPRREFLVGRSYGEAPEIDGLVRVRLPESMSVAAVEPGTLCRVRIVGAGVYDLLAVAEGDV